jgi:membrane-associated phospholipid phosphatase
MAQDPIKHDPPVEQLKEQAKREEPFVEKTTQRAPETATRTVRHYRALLFQIYVLAAVIAFGVLFFFARTTPYFGIDLAVERAVQTIRFGAFDVLMQFVSGLGFNPLAYLLAGLIILYLFVIGLRWEAVMGLFAVLGVALAGMLFKLLVQRERPTPDLVNVFSPLSDYSFPSGHVLAFTAFLGFIWFLLYTIAPHSPRRVLGMVVTGALIALVGISRIYLGQHWPSDVLGAYLFGSVWLAITIYVYRWGKPRFFVRQPAAPEQPIVTTIKHPS